jgi:hypothetical protein
MYRTETEEPTTRIIIESEWCKWLVLLNKKNNI